MMEGSNGIVHVIYLKQRAKRTLSVPNSLPSFKQSNYGVPETLIQIDNIAPSKHMDPWYVFVGNEQVDTGDLMIFSKLNQ